MNGWDKIRFERMPLNQRIDVVTTNAISETTATIAAKARIRFAHAPAPASKGETE